MGLVTIHLVIGVGVLILPLFLVFFSLSTVMSLANLYIMIGSISFVTSVVTTIILVTKFINQPAAHGFFSYSDAMASALLSLGLLLDGVIPFVPTIDIPCYQYALIYSLFIIPIITSFFSVLGMAIERFQAFAVYRDTSAVTKKFSIAWFLSSWTLAVCFVVILIGQIEDTGKSIPVNVESSKHIMEQRKFVWASQIFPGPHSQLWNTDYNGNRVDELVIEGENLTTESEDLGDADMASHNSTSESFNLVEAVNETMEYENKTSIEENNLSIVLVKDLSNEDMLLQNSLESLDDMKKVYGSKLSDSINEMTAFEYNANISLQGEAVVIESTEYKRAGNDAEDIDKIELDFMDHPRCEVKSNNFIMYYFTLLFLLCFATPVLITTSLNVYISSAVKETPNEIISHHQWLTLGACIFMWGPCLVERLLSKWGLVADRLPVAVFLFLLGHTHNLLRCVLHAVFAQQMQSKTRNVISINVAPPVVSWGQNKQNKVKPIEEKDQEKEKGSEKVPEQKRKNTLTPRPPCIGMSAMTATPQPMRRATIPGIPHIQIIETTCT